MLVLYTMGSYTVYSFALFQIHNNFPDMDFADKIYQIGFADKDSECGHVGDDYDLM